MKQKKQEIIRTGGNGRRSTCVNYAGVLYTSNITTVDLVGDMRAQAQDVFTRLDRLMASQGTDRDHILHADVVIQNPDELGDFNQAWDEWIHDGFEPARSVCIAALKLPEYKLSVRLCVATDIG